MKFQAALSKPESSGMSFTLLFTTFLDLMKLAIHNKEVYMFLELISKNSIVPKIEIRWISPSHMLDSEGQLML